RGGTPGAPATLGVLPATVLDRPRAWRTNARPRDGGPRPFADGVRNRFPPPRPRPQHHRRADGPAGRTRRRSTARDPLGQSQPPHGHGSLAHLTNREGAARSASRRMIRVTPHESVRLQPTGRGVIAPAAALTWGPAARVTQQRRVRDV